jgi:CHASE1-domain containing sensor protein
VSSADDQENGMRDMRTAWRTATWVGSALLGCSVLILVLLAWGTALGETDVAHAVRLEANERAINSLEARVEQLQRDAINHERRFHQSTNVPQTSPGIRPR